jgi:hypothetical protein
MQVIKTIVRLLVFFLPVLSYSQSTLLPQGSKFQPLLDRMEIKEQSNVLLNTSSVTKPYNRRIITNLAEQLDSLNVSADVSRRGGDSAVVHTRYSKTDIYNIERLLMNNQEWVNGDKSRFASKHPWGRTFYQTPSDLVQVNQKDFFLVVNPVFNQQQAKETGYGETVFLNSKGLTGRGLIAGKVGFDFYITDNQERTPLFVQARVNEHQAVPGTGFYKSFKTTAYDYFDARGSVYFTASKYINLQFGYDKNFIGNGYRSLFLSDVGTNNLFFKINTRIWKLDYQNLFMELVPSFVKTGDNLAPRKYAAMHHLSLQATRWLNVGLFESVIFGRKDHFDFTYLNPIIFLRSAEQQAGSPDNAMVGFDARANIAGKFQLYTQLLFDEFKLGELRAGNGWWANKFGVQAGAKYIDAFAVKNLDLQGEINIVRPFTYTHSDSVADYSHYNQPLAHPLGANFAEMIGIVKYQPLPKWYGQAKVILFRQGLDTAGHNFGSNIFLSYTTRDRDYGYSIGSGAKARGINASFWIGYELKENLFIDASLLYRKLSVENEPVLSSKTTLFSLGMRMNVGRREYDY